MNRTIARRFAAGLSVLLLSGGVCLAGNKPAVGAAYVEGTITEVPVPTAGNLDLSSKEKVSFRFEKTSFDIPYAAIVEVHPGRKRDGVGSQIAAGAATVGRTVLPVFFPDNKYITVDFRRQTSTNTERMVFQVPEELAHAAIPILESRTLLAKPAKPDPAKAPHNDDAWWGHSWWRTSRNQHRWPTDSDSSKPPSPVPESK